MAATRPSPVTRDSSDPAATTALERSRRGPSAVAVTTGHPARAAMVKPGVAAKPGVGPRHGCATPRGPIGLQHDRRPARRRAVRRGRGPDWSAAADAAYVDLASRCDKVVVAGLSMGGTLTLWLATRHPEIAGIVPINAAAMPMTDMVGLVQAMVDEG